MPGWAVTRVVVELVLTISTPALGSTDTSQQLITFTLITQGGRFQPLAL